MNDSLGKIAYEAYCNYTNWKSLISGSELPQWSQTKPEIKMAWESAADAVRVHLNNDNDKQ